MKLESILLGVLARTPSTGYDLKKFLDTHGRFLRSNTQMSQVYRSLARMEKDGWIRHSVEERPGATDAKTYRVTEEGMTVFLDWLASPFVPPSRFQDPDLGVRLSFAGFMTREQVLRLVDTELEARYDQIARFRDRDRTLTTNTSAHFDAGLAEIVAQWQHEDGIADMDAHVRRLEKLRETLLDTPEPTRSVQGSEATAR